MAAVLRILQGSDSPTNGSEAAAESQPRPPDGQTEEQGQPSGTASSGTLTRIQAPFCYHHHLIHSGGCLESCNFTVHRL